MSTLICPACNYQTDKNELFCSNCGAKLVPVCPSCGAELKPNALFCSQCGAETAKGSKNEEDISVISHPKTKEASDPVQPSSSQLAVDHDNRPQYDHNNKKQAHVFAQQFSEEGKLSKRTNNQFYDKESIKKIAFYHKTFLVFVLISLLIGFLWNIIERSEYGYILSVYKIPVFIAGILSLAFPAIVALVCLRKELKDNIVLTIFISIFLFIPVVNILFIVSTIVRGSQVLKDASYKVGSLGISWKDVKALLNDGSDFWKKNLRAVRVYYLIALVLVAVSCFINYLYLDEIYYSIGNDYLEEGIKDSENHLSSSADSKLKTALLLYRKAAEKGNAMAQYELGEAHSIRKEWKEAMKWYRKAAEQGHAEAQYKLGYCYLNGNGVEQDRKEAVKWWRKAAEQGYAEAQFVIGVLYTMDIDNSFSYEFFGVKHDYNEAIEWFLKAAEQGHAEAQYNLGRYYEQGIGVKQNKTEAVKWYHMAANQGDENAKEALKRLGQ